MHQSSVTQTAGKAVDSSGRKTFTKPRAVSLVIALGVSMTLCSLPAKAAWQSLASSEQGQSFYDDDWQAQGDHISLWRMTDFTKPLTNLEGKEVLSEKTRTTLDCKAGKLANSEVTRFSGSHASGEVMNHYETPLRFTRIAPDSVDALLLQKLCVK